MTMTMSLTDPCASSRAQKLFQFIAEEFGSRILLAQQESPVRGRHEQEIGWLRQLTGEAPAIRGLDFIHDDFQGVIDRSRAWADRGGIVTICWHTGLEGFGYRESQDEHPDISAVLVPGTVPHALWRRKLEQASAALQILQREDIPVLWRPFHEFDGRWFWWGKDGPEAFRQLWRMTRQIMTEEFGLHHLIWVLGFADDVRANWYPGDDVVDIVGSDTYKGTTVHSTAWRKLRAQYPFKPAALHECGMLPDPQDFFSESAVWSWLMPWHGRFMTESQNLRHLDRLYHDPHMITLSRLRTESLY